LKISGQGGYDGKNCVSRLASINIRGQGDASVFVDEHLEVTVSGQGSVKYGGSPEIIQDISGMGSLSPM